MNQLHNEDDIEADYGEMYDGDMNEEFDEENTKHTRSQHSSIPSRSQDSPIPSRSQGSPIPSRSHHSIFTHTHAIEENKKSKEYPEYGQIPALSNRCC